MNGKRASLLCTAFGFLAAGHALADGKFFAGPDAPRAGESFQRAIIVWRDGREMLIVQPQYQGGTAEFGWVVPVPAPPDLGTSVQRGEPGENLDRVFFNFAMQTAPIQIWAHPWVPVVAHAALGLLVLSLAGGLLVGLRVVPKARAAVLAFRLAFVLGLALLIGVISLPSNILGSRTNVAAAAAGEVEVLANARVGVYDVTVIQGTRAVDVQDWLVSHGFRFGSEDSGAFESYVARGWCFVASRIAPEVGEIPAIQGLLPPLVLAFDAAEPVYPFALSATAGEPTEVVLYVLAAGGVEHPALRTMFRGSTMADDALRNIAWSGADAATRNRNSFGTSFTYFALTKLRGKLSSKETTEDLVLKVDGSLPEYREVILLGRW